MPLGQIQVNRMQAAVPLGRKNSFLCFAVKMKYETSVVLGAHTQTELDDWVRSINKMIKGAKATGGGGGKRGVHVIAKGDTGMRSCVLVCSHLVPGGVCPENDVNT